MRFTPLCLLVLTLSGCKIQTRGLPNFSGSDPKSGPGSSSGSSTTTSTTSTTSTTTSGSSAGGQDSPELAALREHSLTKKLGVAAEDSYDLARVTAVFSRVTKADVAIYNGKGGLRYVPVPTNIPRDKAIDQDRYKGGTCDASSKGIGRFGGSTLRETSAPGQLTLDFDLCGGDKTFEQLPAGTPGVIWFSDRRIEGREYKGEIIFVTMDGSRYEIWDEKGITFQAPAASSWPAFPLHSFLGLRELERMPNDSAMKATADAMARSEKDWNSCLRPILDREDAEYEANAKASVTEPQRQAGVDRIAKKYAPLRDKTCGKFKQDYEGALVKFLTERQKQKDALLAANRASLG